MIIVFLVNNYSLLTQCIKLFSHIFKLAIDICYNTT